MSSEKIQDELDASDEFFSSMLDDDVVPLANKGAYRAEAKYKQTPGMAERRKAAQRDESLYSNKLATGDEI